MALFFRKKYTITTEDTRTKKTERFEVDAKNITDALQKGNAAAERGKRVVAATEKPKDK